MSEWHLKKADGASYGPVEESELRAWAADGRVAPDDLLSEDKKEWQPAHELAELDMNWSVEIDGGDLFGPINILAAAELMEEGVVLGTGQAKHRKTGQTITVHEALVTALMDGRKALLAQLEDQRSQHQVTMAKEQSAAKSREADLTRKLAEVLVKYRTVVDRVNKIQASLMQVQASAGQPAAKPAQAAAAEPAKKATGGPKKQPPPAAVKAPAAKAEAETPAAKAPAKASEAPKAEQPKPAAPPAEKAAPAAPPAEEPPAEAPSEATEEAPKDRKRFSVGGAFKSAAARIKTQSSGAHQPSGGGKGLKGLLGKRGKGGKGISSSDIPRGPKHGG